MGFDPYTRTKLGHIAYASVWIVLGIAVCFFPGDRMPRAYFVAAGVAIGVVGILTMFIPFSPISPTAVLRREP